MKVYFYNLKLSKMKIKTLIDQLPLEAYYIPIVYGNLYQDN